ncbi:MAG: hypothetical protein CMP75_01655 [Flavobacteriales bacterium]|nr:hypothetical protein [Flavobacteriales bacterium]
MKKILLILIFIPLLFISCEKLAGKGTVEYQITSTSDYFHVYYTNQYDNEVTEVSYSNNWSKQVEGKKGDAVTLNFNEGGPTWGSGIDTDENVEVNMSISFNGNILISYAGLTEYESLITILE